MTFFLLNWSPINFIILVVALAAWFYFRVYKPKVARGEWQ